MQPAQAAQALGLITLEHRRYFHFVNVALFLALVTGLEIVLIFLPLNRDLLMTALVVLSSIKFGCVILWFMHLIYDRLFLLLLFLFALAVAGGTVISLLLMFHRGDVDLPG